jgi:hypothetical protein
VLRGFIDLVDPARVVGWAAHDDGVAPELTVLIDGQQVGRITPNLERADLKAAFPNNINLGFSFRMPRPLTGDATIAVIDPFGCHLSQSPYRFDLPDPGPDPRYDMRLPAESNALDIFQGQWSAVIPGFGYGTALSAETPHVRFFEQQIGGFSGKRILELGPLEASHTHMMSKAGAAHILAIEANKNAFLKCLIVKELLAIENADFLLGDFYKYLTSSPQRFDAILAAGVLYHMSDPLGLIEGAVRAANSIGVWTHYFDAERIRPRPYLSEKFDASPRTVSFHGRSIEQHTQRYLDAPQWAGFCGGSEPTSVWLTKEGILSAFDCLGFEVVIGQDEPDHPNGPAFSFVASKRRGRVSEP